MSARSFTGALLLLLAWGCGSKPAPSNAHGGASGASNATCAEACAHLTTLGCPQSKPTPQGQTCEQVCEDTQRSGIAALDLGCAVRATCDAIDTCKRAVTPQQN